MNCLPQDAQARTTRLSFPPWLGCFFHHAFLHFMEQKRWLALALSGSRFPHIAHFWASGFFCRCTNTFSAETSMPSSADISLYCLPAARMSRIVLFSFSVIEKCLLSPGSRERRQKGTFLFSVGRNTEGGFRYDNSNYRALRATYHQGLDGMHKGHPRNGNHIHS